MSSRHIEPGAGEEWANPFDYSCDYCAKTVYSGRLYPYKGRHLCAACAVRESKEPACDYCNAPTFGDYRTINLRASLSIACGVCTDKWDERYEGEVA